jgi:hypothetical protein
MSMSERYADPPLSSPFEPFRYRTNLPESSLSAFFSIPAIPLTTRTGLTVSP